MLIRYIFHLSTLIQCCQLYSIVCSWKKLSEECFLIFLVAKIQGLLLFGGLPDSVIWSLLWSLSSLWCLFHLVAIVTTNLENPAPFIMASVSAASKNSALSSDLSVVLRHFCNDPRQGHDDESLGKLAHQINNEGVKLASRQPMGTCYSVTREDSDTHWQNKVLDSIETRPAPGCRVTHGCDELIDIQALVSLAIPFASQSSMKRLSNRSRSLAGLPRI